MFINKPVFAHYCAVDENVVFTFEMFTLEQMTVRNISNQLRIFQICKTCDTGFSFPVSDV